jgi:hypothetical protein
MGIAQVVSAAPASPWQNPYVEGVIGSIPRECLDHVIIFNVMHLSPVLRPTSGTIIGRGRTSGSRKDVPDHRAVSGTSTAPIVPIAEVDGLRHRYERRAV